MTREEVIKLKEQKPYHYISLLKSKHADAWNEIASFNEMHGFSKIPGPQMVYNWLNDITEWPKCEVCGKPSSFTSMGKLGYNNTCSRLCARRAKSTMDKRKETALRKYGVEHATQAKEVKDKIKEANRRKYGVDCVLSKKDIQEKIRRTNLKRYGVEYPTMSPEVLARREENNIKKYGVGSPMQTNGVLTKMLDTTKRKFGVYPAPVSTKNLASHNKRKSLKAFEALKTKYDKYELLTTKEEYETRYGHLKWRCRICGAIFETCSYTSRYPRCKCQHRDKEEVEFFNFIKSVAPDAELNNRSVLPNGKEIDVYIPSKRIGFEFDGLYWHSELRVNNNYHLQKTEDAKSVGVRLLHFFSDEWEQKTEIVKESIRYLLHSSPLKHVYARDCTCRTIDKGQARLFLDAHHIQGRDLAKHYIGLLDKNGILVAVASFNPERKGGDSYILSRYATDIKYCLVVGGLGKMLSHFIRERHPSKIKTYADRRISEGDIYEKTGFRKTGVIPPKYWYTKTFKERIHRFNLRKSKFNKDGMMYESNSTEKQLAEINGFTRIYDCGYYRYELTP